MTKEYQKTKGLFYVFNPDAKDYYKGQYRGAAQYTKYQWEAHEYKTVQGALTVAERLGAGFIVVDANGRQHIG